MATKIQVVVLDSKDYILRYKDFGWADREKMLEYVKEQIMVSDSTKVHIRKWPS